jgi:hypothetical protein
MEERKASWSAQYNEVSASMPRFALWEQDCAIGDSTIASLSSSLIVPRVTGSLPRETMDGSFDGATSIAFRLTNWVIYAIEMVLAIRLQGRKGRDKSVEE